MYNSVHPVNNYGGYSHIDFPMKCLNSLAPTGLPLHIYADIEMGHGGDAASQFELESGFMY